MFSREENRIKSFLFAKKRISIFSGGTAVKLKSKNARLIKHGAEFKILEKF